MDPGTVMTMVVKGPEATRTAATAFPSEVSQAERALLKRRALLIVMGVINLTLLLFMDITLLFFFASGANKSFSLSVVDAPAQVALAVSIPVALLPQVGFMMRMLDPKAVGESSEITDWVRGELAVLKQARRASLRAANDIAAADAASNGANAAGDAQTDVLVDVNESELQLNAEDSSPAVAGAGRSKAKVVPTLGE